MIPCASVTFDRATGDENTANAFTRASNLMRMVLGDQLFNERNPEIAIEQISNLVQRFANSPIARGIGLTLRGKFIEGHFAFLENPYLLRIYVALENFLLHGTVNDEFRTLVPASGQDELQMVRYINGESPKGVLNFGWTVEDFMKDWELGVPYSPVRIASEMLTGKERIYVFGWNQEAIRTQPRVLLHLHRGAQTMLCRNCASGQAICMQNNRNRRIQRGNRINHFDVCIPVLSDDLGVCIRIQKHGV